MFYKPGKKLEDINMCKTCFLGLWKLVFIVETFDSYQQPFLAAVMQLAAVGGHPHLVTHTLTSETCRTALTSEKWLLFRV